MGAEAIAVTENLVSLDMSVEVVEPRYLFADSEPFPQGFDFIAALSGFVELAVAVLSRARESRALEANIAEARAALAERIGALDGLVAGVSTVAQGAVAGPSQEAFMLAAAQRLERSAEDLCAATRHDLEQTFEAERVRLERAAAVLHAGMVDAVRAFLLRCELELLSQDFTVELQEQGYRAQLTQRLAGQISVTYDLDSKQTAWAQPRRVGDFVRAVSVDVGPRRSWLTRAVSVESRALDEFVIGSVRLTGQVCEIGLRRKRDAPDTLAVHLSFGERGVAAQIVRAENPSSIFDVPSATTSKLLDLWTALRKTSEVELAARTAVRHVSIDGNDALDAPGAELLIERLVDVYRPIVAEVARRSRSPSELSLKRTVSDGRREERYVSRQYLLDQLNVLAADDLAKLASLRLAPASVPPLRIPGSEAPPPLFPRPNSVPPLPPLAGSEPPVLIVGEEDPSLDSA